jgi:hypothetical protein
MGGRSRKFTNVLAALYGAGHSVSQVLVVAECVGRAFSSSLLGRQAQAAVAGLYQASRPQPLAQRSIDLDQPGFDG